MAFNRDTLAKIKERLINRVNADLRGGDASLRHSVEGVIATLCAMTVHEINGYLSWISKQILLETADDENVEMHAGGWSIYRKAPSAATGTAQFQGTNGAVIGTGAVLKRADNVEYITLEDITITGGSGSGAVQAVNTGADGNCGIGVKVTLIAPVAGVQSEGVVIDDGSGAGITGGADIEEIEDLRARALARKRRPPQGGAANDYEDWAKSVAGVTRAWTYPNQYGAGTVGVTFVMDNKAGTIIPSAGEVATVQEYIDERRPVTADVTVFAPVLVPVAFEIHIDPNTASVRAAIEAELRDLFKREGKPNGTIYISRIREAISVASGEFDHVLVSPVANIEMAFGEMPDVGIITWEAL